MKVFAPKEKLLKNLQKKKEKLDVKRQEVLNREKQHKANVLEFCKKAYLEAMNNIDSELQDIVAGKNVIKASSLISIDSEYAKIKGTQYRSKISVKTSIDRDAMEDDPFRMRREREDLNAMLSNVREMIALVELSANDTIEVDTEKGLYFEVMRY